MQPYPPFPPDVEYGLVFALRKSDPNLALEVLRRWKPGWGESDHENGLFGLAYPLERLPLFLESAPPHIDHLDEETKKQLRVMSLMIQFAGGERYSGCTRWSPGAVEWKSWQEPVLLARMCFFWAASASDYYSAIRSGCKEKRVLGFGNRKGDKHDRCSYCSAMRPEDFMSIHAEFEPGVAFPPFRNCIHPLYGCRCQLEFR
jgi:hypothetical protein